MYKIEDIARYFLSRGAMSQKKLQKLIYYAYAWTLTLLNDSSTNIQFRLFKEKIEAWIHGPVIPEIYHKYKAHGWNDIPMEEQFDDSIFPPDVLDILNQVWNVYGCLTADKLEAISHREFPWKNARGTLSPFEICNEKLSDEDIFNFYITVANEE